MKISSKSAWLRFAYFGSFHNCPKQISFCGLLGRTILVFWIWCVIVCAGSVFACFLSIITPIALVFGHRPCFIKFMKNPSRNASPFQKYDLPEVLGIPVWPVMYVAMIIYGYLLAKYLSPENYFVGTKHFFIGWCMVVMGCVGLFQIAIENIPYHKFKKLPGFDYMLASFQAFKAKTCPNIEIVS